MPAFAQMLGRVARGLENDGDDPPFVWLVSVNISSLSFILSRIGRCEPDGNRRRQRKDLWEVLHFLFLPVKCYHLRMKELFSNPFETTGGGGGACGANCPFCRGELGLAVVQEEVARELDRGCFRRGTMEMSEVARCLYEARSDLWAGSERVAVWRDVHRLVLQLVAAKIVDVEMEESGERPGMAPLRIPSTSLGQTLRRPRRVLVLEPAGARAPGSGSTRPRAHGRGSSSSHHRLLPLLLTRKFI